MKGLVFLMFEINLRPSVLFCQKSVEKCIILWYF